MQDKDIISKVLKELPKNILFNIDVPKLIRRVLELKNAR